MNSANKVIQTLSKTADDLFIQSEVTSILDGVISDIEIAHGLEEKLNQELVMARLRERCSLAEKALSEYKAMAHSEEQKRMTLGELLLEDLFKLEGMMEGRIEGTTEEAGMDITRTTGTDNAEQEEETPTLAEDPADGAHEVMTTNSNINDAIDIGVTDTSTPGNLVSEHVATNQPNSILIPAVASAGSGPDAAAGEGSPMVSQQPLEATLNETSQKAEELTPSPVIDEQQHQEKELTSPKVSIPPKTKIKTPKPPSLESLNSTLLMSVFEYMEALEIVNMAQTSVRLYSKVDSIFGLGGTIVAGDRSFDEEDYEEDMPETAAVVLVEDDSQEEEEEEDAKVEAEAEGDTGFTNQTPPVMDVIESSSEIPKSSSANDMKSSESQSSIGNGMAASVSSDSSQYRATVVSIPSKVPKSVGGKPPAPTPTTNTTATKEKPISNESGNNTLAVQNNTSINTTSTNSNANEPSNQTSATVTSTSTVTTTATTTTTPSANGNKRTNTNTSSTTSSSGYQISPAVAQSLAMKLTPVELSAIISMRDQLRKKEIDMQRMKQDFDDMTVQLDGTLAVKEVLTDKVEELRKTLKKDREVSAKITRQTASDQEVIAFLDERVQELERAVDNHHQERMEAGKSVDKVKQASERQVEVLTDMLAYEREQKVDAEKEWKSTKKVLVKEVKHCRARILALEAERDGFRQENDRLREALLSLSSKANRSFESSLAEF